MITWSFGVKIDLFPEAAPWYDAKFTAAVLQDALLSFDICINDWDYRIRLLRFDLLLQNGAAVPNAVAPREYSWRDLAEYDVSIEGNDIVAATTRPSSFDITLQSGNQSVSKGRDYIQGLTIIARDTIIYAWALSIVLCRLAKATPAVTAHTMTPSHVSCASINESEPEFSVDSPTLTCIPHESEFLQRIDSISAQLAELQDFAAMASHAIIKPSPSHHSQTRPVRHRQLRLTNWRSRRRHSQKRKCVPPCMSARHLYRLKHPPTSFRSQEPNTWLSDTQLTHSRFPSFTSSNDEVHFTNTLDRMQQTIQLLIQSGVSTLC
ncbi:hypothetical protein BZG36_04672 [Bifiguratus adelaidae]|uniref:Uncharacterized protein n=1 Tax=Bifiguratus adelaidae TaxID=1938954 RepID=A0A261XWL2_9FUNG|nr:hypothetical protein BZG36_04672 [Bifiguratus adelaidae]